MYFDNLLALWIAIKYQLTPEDAFKALDNIDDLRNRKYFKHNWSKEDLDDMQKLRNEGWTLTQIGEFYGIKQSRVCHILNRKKFEIKDIAKEVINLYKKTEDPKVSFDIAAKSLNINEQWEVLKLLRAR